MLERGIWVLKKFKNSDLDNVMNIWKKAYAGRKNKLENKDFAQTYTEIRDILLDESSNTTLYTEDDKIEGFIIIDKNKRIIAIYVDTKIRREGIGTMLINSCKNKYQDLTVTFWDDDVYKSFFEKNNFELKTKSDDLQYTYEWISEKERRVNLIYFDSDLDEELLDKNERINAKKIKISEILRDDNELKSVKNYIKVRKSIENAFDKKMLVYLNYGTYNQAVNDIIKDIAKIEKAKIAIIISEPVVSEGTKVDENLKKIEQSYKGYKLYKLDILDNLKKDASISEIIKQRMGIIISKIEKIAENM